MPTCNVCGATYPDSAGGCPRDHGPASLGANEDAPLSPGTMVGEHRIERRLGMGTFGDVYAGEHAGERDGVGKRVAIKLLRRQLSQNAEVVARFIAEARAINRIHHRNIVDVFSFGTFEDRHYYAMELLDGLTLGELLDREPRLRGAKALPILQGIAAALDAAHQAGVVHRDIKPDNVFLVVEPDGSYTPKLVDFGLAKLLTDDMGVKTATGVAVGTPRYMSPEQCRGRNVDHRTDIYALGVLAHRMLTGHAPFEGNGLVQMLLKHTMEPPPSMSSVCADLPAALDAPVLAMLAKRPGDRPDSAGQAIAALAERMRPPAAASTMPLGTIVMTPPPTRAPESPAAAERAAPAAQASSGPVGPLGTVLLDPPPRSPDAAVPPTLVAGPGAAPARAPVEATERGPIGALPPASVEAPLVPAFPALPTRLPRTSHVPTVAVIALAVVALGALTLVALRSRAPSVAAPVEAASPSTRAPADSPLPATTVAPPGVVPSATASEVPEAPSASASPSTPKPATAPPGRPTATPAKPAGKSRDIGF